MAEPLREEALRALTNLLVTTGRPADAIGLGQQRFLEIMASHAHNLDDDLQLASREDSWTLNFLAWKYATCESKVARDGKLAIAYATKAVELTDRSNYEYIDTLAAAYAEDRQFTNAIFWQKKVIDSSRAGAWKDSFLGRLRQYEAEKMDRDVP